MPTTQVEMEQSPSFLARHEFLIRRLHSLCGLVPVGAYMVIHLLTNATVMDSAATFQRNVHAIHGLGRILPVVEWGFIFLPILFHAIFGVVIILGGSPNSQTYTYSSNLRYTLQRVTGMIAFLFIMWHVFHMHGWFHAEWWIEKVAGPLGGAKFRPFNATSSAGSAMQASLLVQVGYAVGVLACVFHLANGIWTMGITWGVWVSPESQRRANYVCGAFGLGLAAVGLSALLGFSTTDVEAAREIEDRMYEAKTATGDIDANEHKRSGDHGSGGHDGGDPDSADSDSADSGSADPGSADHEFEDVGENESNSDQAAAGSSQVLRRADDT